MAGGLYWQVTASVSQIARSVGDPSTSRSYFQPPSQWLRAHGGSGVRVEVPPTANHWESAYLASQFELARGWLRQLDTTRDDIFYDEKRAHRRHLRPLAAPERDLLRRPARRAARLLLGRRAAADPARAALPEPALELAPLADLRRAQSRAAGRADGRPRRRTRSGWDGRASASTSPAPATSSSASTSPPTGRSRAAPAACCAAASGPSPTPRIPGIFRVSADFSVGRAWNAVTGAKKTC